jgi:hypothetical protein
MNHMKAIERRCARPLALSPGEAERMKLAAYEHYAALEHADIRVGWQEYLDTCASIDGMARLDGERAHG